VQTDTALSRGSLYVAVSIFNVLASMLGRLMNDQLERIWKETVMLLSWYYPGYFSRGTEENHEELL
jgi:hypothetical protein